MDNLCLVERFSKIGIAAVFLMISFAFILSGITVLPFVGFVIALPFVLFSIYFFRAHLNKECQIEEPTE